MTRPYGLALSPVLCALALSTPSPSTWADTRPPCPTLEPGYRVNPNEQLNEASIRDWAGHGVVKAQAMLGEILLVGKLAKRDPQEASYWLNCAAQTGDARAALNLAMQIYHQDGIEQDFRRAFKLAQQSANAGDAMGQRMVGTMYDLGQGVPRDVVQAIKWYAQAAQQGDVEIQAALGYRFLIGDGVARDLDQAIKWLRLAADAGHEQSRNNLEIALCIREKRCDATGKTLGGSNGRDGDQVKSAKPVEQRELVLAAHWKAGQRMTYLYEKTRQRAGVAPRSASYEVLVKVLQANADGYLLELTLPGMQLPETLEADPKAQELVASVARLGKATRLEILTDGSGALKELRNWRQARDALIGFIDQVGAPISPAARHTLNALYADEASTRQTMLRDLDFFLRPLGDELIPGEPQEVEVEAQVPVLGLLKARESYRLQTDQPKTGLATETFDRTFDENALADAVDSFLKKSTVQGSAPRQRLINQMKVHDHAAYVVDLATGWLVSGEHTRDAGVNESGPVETTVLRVRRK